MSVTPMDLINAGFDIMRRERLVQWDRMREKCESPIEEMFLAAAFAASFDNSEPLHIYLGKFEMGYAPFDDMHLWPQAKVDQYRVDFMFLRSKGDERNYVAVECDGHEFHEKTKQQAARDKARDRHLVGRGIKVMRFTGSEIYRDAFACWAEVSKVLLGLKLAA